MLTLEPAANWLVWCQPLSIAHFCWATKQVSVYSTSAISPTCILPLPISKASPSPQYFCTDTSIIGCHQDTLGSSPASLPPCFLPMYVAKSLSALIALLRAGWSRSLQRPVNFKGQALYMNTPVAVCFPCSRLCPHHLPRIKAHKDQAHSAVGAAG